MALYLFLCMAVTAFFYSSAQENAPGERELRRDLFRDYDKNSRPVKKHSTAVTVKVSLSPLSLKYLNEKSQLISLETYFVMTWLDEFLTWDPEEYDGITELDIPTSQVWKPDIALYTASPDTSLFPIVDTKLVLFNNGTLIWVPPFTMNSRCPIPFQNHVSSTKAFVECNLRMGSWTNSIKTLDLQLASDKVDLTNFLDNNYEWKLVKMVSDRESKIYPCCPDEYPYVDFNITLKRRNSFLNLESDN